MRRIEIIANRSIQEDLFDALKDAGAAEYYTLYPIVFGVGKTGPRRGDHIWPEENFCLIVYCDEEEAEKIKTVVKKLKKVFTQEGIKLFDIGYE